MVRRFNYRGITWIDIESPTRSELLDLINEFKLPPHVIEELESPSLKPRVDLYKDFIYLILHFPAFRHSHLRESNQEMDFIIGEDFLATVHYDVIDSIDKFSKEFEVDTILERHDLGKHAGFIFLHMLKKLYSSLDHELEYIGSSIDGIEARIFTGREKELVGDISKISRNLLVFKQSTNAHGEVLASFQTAARSFFGDEFEDFLRNVLREYRKLRADIEDFGENLMELRDTNNSLLNTKQNEAMKIVAIMAFITFPLSLVASIFGMNTSWLPIVGIKGDFWIVMAIMGALTFLFFVYFKKKDWL